MRSKVPVPSEGQLDFFAPEREVLAANLLTALHEPTPEIIQSLYVGSNVLRLSHNIDESVVAAVDTYMDRLPSVLKKDGSLPEPLACALAGIGIEVSAIVCSSESLDRQQKSLLYVSAEEALSWLEAQDQTTPEFLIIPSVRFATIYGYKGDLARAYRAIDARRNMRRSCPPETFAGFGMHSLRVLRALVDLAQIDDSRALISRMHGNHLDEVPRSDGLSAEMEAIYAALDLAKIVGIAEKRWQIPPRIIRYAVEIGLPLDQYVAEAYYNPQENNDPHTARLFDIVVNELAG